MTTTVGVRELRQNLSKYVEQLEGGASFIVTRRGREIGRLTPSGGGDRLVERLLARGAQLPTRSLVELLDEDRQPVPGPPSQHVLDELREERL